MVPVSIPGSVKKMSLEACKQACLKTRDCTALNYESKRQECSLSTRSHKNIQIFRTTGVDYYYLNRTKKPSTRTTQVKSPVVKKQPVAPSSEAKPRTLRISSPTKTGGTCDYTNEILALEKRGQELTMMGERLKKMQGISLPEFPQLDFCVSSSPGELKVDIKNDGAVQRKIINAVELTESLVGWLGDIKSILPTNAQEAVEHFDPRQLMTSVLRFMRGKAQSRWGGSSQRDGVIQFLRETTQLSENVQRIRQVIVCGVKEGVPKFYQRFAAFEREVDQLKRQIDSNASCSPRQKRGLQRTTMAKAGPAKRIYRWHAEGVLTAPGQPKSGHKLRRNWLDSRLASGGKPMIFNEVTCPLR